ncbi:MAG: RNA polymerase sigma factor [Flexibacteraceae bacterium]
MEDQEILQRIKKRDERALEYLYKKHYKMMLNMVVKNSGSEDEAKDIFQDALIVFWEKVTGEAEFVLSAKLSTYLYSICQNLWRKELERKTRNSGEMVENSEVIDHDREERENIIQKCINSLNDSCKQILTLYYFEKMSMGEIAELMGLSNADTAKTKKYKCKQELDKTIKLHYQAGDFLD